MNVDLDYKINLEPLSDNEVLNIVRERLSSYDLSNDALRDIITEIRREGLKAPGYIINVINNYFRKRGFQNTLLASSSLDICQSYVLRKGLDLTCPKILIPEHNKIIIPQEIRNDVNVINRLLLSQIAGKPEVLYSLTDRQFEETVCEMFEKNGYKVRLTKQTHDGGKDLIIINRSLLGDFVFYVECKKYAYENPVGVNLVRQLYGTVAADRATAGIFITTSYFTKYARNFARGIHTQLNLVDYAQLINEIQNIDLRRITNS